MPAPAPPSLRTEHLGRTVGDRALVADVSVEVGPGDVLALVGPSGAGKSSLLRLLNRLDEPTAGTVYLGGVDYRTIPPQDLRRRVGMVMQTAALFPGTVGDNVRFGPRQAGRTLDDARVATLLEQVGLPGLAGSPVDDLSGGEAQRVSIARAVANDPEVLLLDEPTSALDARSKQGIEALVLEVIRSRRLACVVITHDLTQAARMATRVLVMEAGRVKRLGTVSEVMRAEVYG